MSIVDPPTCGCVLPTACEVHIPNAHFVGLRCNGQQVRFCCRRKKNPNAKTNFRLTPGKFCLLRLYVQVQGLFYKTCNVVWEGNVLVG